MVVPEPISDGESAQDQVIAALQCITYLPPDLTLLYNLHLTK